MVKPWAHHEAGLNKEYLITDGHEIRRVIDKSIYRRDLIAGSSPPATRKGVTLGSWSTQRYLLGVDEVPGKEWFGNTYTLSTPFYAQNFYILVVFANSRPGGLRQLLGYRHGDIVHVDQTRNKVTLQNTDIVPEGALPKGPILMELVCKNGKLRTVVNNVLKSTVPCSRVHFEGVGYDGTGSSHWDDYLFEILWFQGKISWLKRKRYMRASKRRWGL